MSGHSKWSTIKHRKAATDKKRADLFSKLAREISIAARQGGADINMNYALRSAVEKARGLNMPKENIERAIKKGAGEDTGEQLTELLMEAYGPGGVALLIEAISDNRNRITGDLRHILSKNDGKLAAEGSVKWLFERKLSLGIPVMQVQNKNAFELEAIDLGAQDIIWPQDEGSQDAEVLLDIKPENLRDALQALEARGFTDISTHLEWVAKDKIQLEREQEVKLQKLYDALAELDDVQEIYTNAA